MPNNEPFEVAVKPGQVIRTGQAIAISEYADPKQAELMTQNELQPGYTGAIAVEDSRDGKVRAVRSAPGPVTII